MLKAAVLQVDELGKALGELLDTGGVAHQQTFSSGGGGASTLAGDVSDLVAAYHPHVAEEHAQAGAAVKAVEGVQVAADRVAFLDLTFDGQRCRNHSLSAMAQRDDVVDLRVLA